MIAAVRAWRKPRGIGITVPGHGGRASGWADTDFDQKAMAPNGSPAISSRARTASSCSSITETSPR